MKEIKESERLFARAEKRIPGGVNSPVRAFGAVGGTPRFVSEAHGSRLTDADGNEYIDYVCAYGPGILGHAHPRVVQAVREACGGGFGYGAPTEREAEMAECLARMVPSAEMSRLVNSGTEAVMSAIRVARGYTGRDKIIKFQGCYHGHSDGLLVKSGSFALTSSAPDSAGVPLDYTRNTLTAGYNSRADVEKLFAANPGGIAAVIVEPVAANMGVVLPEPGFLDFLGEITKDNGSLLIFDEVITGFRLALGGAQEFFGVKPDMTVLGKIIGGGMPVGAFCGRKDIMEMTAPSGAVYQAGTLSGNPVATAAGLSALRTLEEDPGIYDRLAGRTKWLADEIREAGKGKVCVNQIGSLLSIFFTDAPVDSYNAAKQSDTRQFAVFFHSMLEEGIWLAPSQFEAMFVSDAHTDGDIEETAEKMTQFIRRMK